MTKLLDITENTEDSPKTSYGAAQKKYYEANKHLIAGRTRKYKKEYNRMYYKRNKAKMNKAALEYQRKKRTDLATAVQASFEES